MASNNHHQRQVTDIEHPSHVLRLLRLVREGTPSHASRASALLARYASSCCSGDVTIHHVEETDQLETPHRKAYIHPSLIVWDLIGRLVSGDGKFRKSRKGDTDASPSGLFDLHWETRSNCALALESVAKCLPAEDRRHFFEDNNETDNDSLSWLTVHDLRAKLSNSRSDKDSNAVYSKQKSKAISATNKYSDKGNENQMCMVIKHGRLLLASSGERYDWPCDDDEEAKEYISEQQALQSLDGTANQKSAQKGHQTFLRRRIQLQRQILAKRIGLGGILSTPIANINGNTTQQSLVNDIIGDEEFLDGLTPPNTTFNQKRKSKKQSGKTNYKSSTKRPRKSRKKDSNEEDKYLPKIDIRRLLIAESKYSSDNPKCRSRHRNPQLLLSTEIAYRTFDPQWTVRHGALLATLSLLRAWRIHDSSCIRKPRIGDSSSATPSVFGKWPHDILARCVCIIALDRFADFSGSDIRREDTTDTIVSDAIVAPVREMTAQIIAILLEAAPSSVWDCTFDLLMQLYNRRCDNVRNGWEIKQGVLLVWKYLCSLAQVQSKSKFSDCQMSKENRMTVLPTFPLSKQYTSSQLSMYKTTFNNIIIQSIRGLSDDSDDVRAVSAQVLLEALKMNENFYTIDIVKECSRSVWDAILGMKNDVSSCVPDLLALFATILACSPDCTSTMLKITSTHVNVGEYISFDIILNKLISFLSFGSAHVQASCFKSLSLVMKSMADSVVKAEDPNTNFELMIRATCSLVEKLFYDHCEIKVDTSFAEVVSKYRDEVWDITLDSLAVLLSLPDIEDEYKKNIQDTTLTLILRYFDICKQSILEMGQSTIELSFRGINNNSTGLMRALPYHSNDSFAVKTASSMALARFYMKIGSRDMYSAISVAIQTFFQSPWLEQCEASCLLHTAIASLYTKGIPFLDDYVTDLTNLISDTPPCILIDGSSLSYMILRDSKVQSLSDNALCTLLTNRMNSLHVTDSRSLCNDFLSLQKSIFNDRGVSFQELSKLKQATSTKSSMRLNASIAGAIIYCGSNFLPARITPLIQSLMTSLKSEDCEVYAAQTRNYIARLVFMISDNHAHHRARNKLLENVYALASDGYDESLELSHASITARRTLELIVNGISCQKELENFPVIWDKLSLLNSFSTLTIQQQFDSTLMLSIVSKTLKQADGFLNSILSRFIEPVIQISCYNQSILVRRQASASVINFCQIFFDQTMNATLIYLLPVLADINDEKGRTGGCKLLVDILQKFSVSVSPFVTKLLPQVMRLMTDTSEECSKYASNAFAILVQVAPLAANHIGQNIVTSSSDKVSQDVIQHLILGKPLPPCTLPPEISKALAKNGTTLRSYQMEGISWMKFLSEVHLNGALCDDMGLGKTLQALVAIAISHCSESDKSTSRKRSLVICPSSVVGHWLREIHKFFPCYQVLSPFDFTGSPKKRRHSWDKDLKKHNIVVTSYSVLRSDIDLLEKTTWDYCVLDEGHLLKNPKTITAKASRRIKAHHKLILTGTPIQNNVHEVWATFNFLMPNFLGSESSFTNQFAKPIINGQKLEASASDMKKGTNCLKILHQQVLPFVLRREKGQVMKELPPKIITNIPCVLSSHQKRFYKAAMEQNDTKAALDLMDNVIKSSEETVQYSDTQKLRSNTLTSLLQLRMICTHPILYSLFKTKDEAHLNISLARLDSSGKLMALNDILRHSRLAGPEITAADNDSSGFQLDFIDDIANGVEDNILIDDGCVEDTIDRDPNEHESTTNEQSKCLIFAQFTQSLDVVEQFLFEPHMPSLEYLRLDGNVPSNQRSAIVDRFNEDKNIKVLLLTTKVGGLGLNLTGADKVIFLEPDWNPFVDLQAMDRAHRIGQTKTVYVYRLITTDTIEEKILKLQDRKRATAEAVVNTDNSTLYSMGTDRLLDIFTFSGSSRSTDCGDDDNVLSYLDDAKSEYSSLSVSAFLSGLK